MTFLKKSRCITGGVLFLFLLFLFRANGAEEIKPYFSHLRTEGGLSHNKVNCILQDKRGFIWLGTEDGLNRYDGKYYSLFNNIPGDTTCISGNIITDLLEDSDGILWIATADGGLTRYDYRLSAGRQFRQLKHRDADSHSIPDNNIGRIILDGQGYLWLTTGSHSLIRYNRKTGLFDSPVRDGPLNITSICLDRSGILWAATAGEGVLKVDTRTLNYRLEHSPGMESMTGLYEDNWKNIWYGQPDRVLHRYDAVTGRDMIFKNAAGKRNIPEDEVVCFAEDRSDHLWMGGRYSGVYVYDKNSGQFAHFWHDPLEEGSIIDNHINCICIDRSGIVWIGTNKGVSFYNPLFEPFVQTFLPASKNDIELFDFYRDDEDKSLWIATSDGIYIQRAGAASFEHRKLSYKGKSLLVTKFFRDVDGAFYLRTDYMRFAYDRRLDRLSPLPNADANADGKGWQIARKLIPAEMLYDVQEDRSGNLWISTYGNGLNFYDAHAKTFSHIRMSSNLTEGIQADEKGNIWMISNGHLHKYDPSTQTYSCYELPSARRNGIKGYMYKDNQDNMYAAGMNYYIRFRPETVAAINMEPEVWLTDLKVNNRSCSELLENKVIRLNHNENFFSIEFSAPEFSGDNLQYSYQLEGADKGWIESNKRNYASYSDLSAGEYVFRVKATNWKGCDSDKISSIRIIIVPPFWRTWWFYLLSLLLVAGIFYAIYRYRIREYLKRQSIRNRIALDLHDNIGATLSSISIYSQVARIYQDQQEDEQLRGVLDRIDKTAGEAINEMSDMVWAINPRNDDMHNIVARMQTYAEPLCTAKAITFEFRSDDRIGKLNMEMIQRKNLYFIYKEIVNNALKYSGCTKVEVLLILENYIFRMVVRDNGKGFDINTLRNGSFRTLSGNGLYNMEKRATEIKAALTIDSQPGGGTMVELSFRIS